MSAQRDRLLQRREVVTRDLAELSVQLDEGEIDENTAERLREGYQTELATLEAELNALPSPVKEAPTDVEQPEPAEPSTRSPARMVAGTLIVAVVVAAVIGFVMRDAEPDPGGSSTAPGGLIVDPASVSNEELEAVIAANPNINGMRMALADRYFEAGDYSPALGHYLYIADNAPTPAEETKVLARIGWMAYRTGLADEAASYLDASLTVDPANAEAIVFRGFVSLYGLDDPAAAIPQLEAALELPNLSDNVIGQIEDALRDARSREAP